MQNKVDLLMQTPFLILQWMIDENVHMTPFKWSFQTLKLSEQSCADLQHSSSDVSLLSTEPHRLSVKGLPSLRRGGLGVSPRYPKNWLVPHAPHCFAPKMLILQFHAAFGHFSQNIPLTCEALMGNSVV